MFETTIYLINRMLTPVLRNKSSFEYMFHQTPNYSFLRTFGCLCFPFLRPYNAHKLNFHSTPCVFLRYNSCHLGYRCLDLFSHRVYISRRDRFHKQSFPFLETAHVSTIFDSDPQPTPSSHLPALTHFSSIKTPSTLSK